MQFYFAPMEGVTTHIYRRAFNRYFPGMDKFFSPFITPSCDCAVNTRQRQDLLPENNPGMHLVPQILTCSSTDFLSAAKVLGEMGYREVNLNLGCPSSTVVGKGKGSGFLKEPYKLKHFFEEIFSGTDMAISVKTRIGFWEAEEFANLMAVYRSFPLKELIIHPRVRMDFYKGTPDYRTFGAAAADAPFPVCYNGDIFTIEDYQKMCTMFPVVESVMIGRGLLGNPGLRAAICGEEDQLVTMARIKGMYEDIEAELLEEISGERQVLSKLKEYWAYILCVFTHSQMRRQQILRSKDMLQYREIAAALFEEERIDAAGSYRELLQESQRKGR